MPDRIFKYTLQAEGRQLLQLPRGAKLLSVIMQNNLPVVYALVDETQPPEQRIFRIVSTGEEFNAEGCEFIGTFVAEGWFVGHVFEQTEGNGPDPVSDRYAEDFREIGRNMRPAAVEPPAPNWFPAPTVIA